MKTSLLLPTLFAILLFVSPANFAQVNSYFEYNPVWQQSSSCAVPAPCIRTEQYNYYTNGDTSIHSLVYKKIYKKGQGTFNWMSPLPNPGCWGTYSYIDTVPSYFLRSAGKQMFLRQPSDTSEYLLYDFNLAVNDTLPVSYNNYATDVTVTAIDSIYTPYGYRQRFALAGNTWAQYLLEGIGHSLGLIEPLQIPLECGFDLDCFGLNDTAYYPVLGPTCNLTVGITEFYSSTGIIVYPNPAHDQLFLKSDIPLTGVTIYNTLGEIVLDKQVTDRTATIDIARLDNGVYFILLVSGTKKTRQQLIKN